MAHEISDFEPREAFDGGPFGISVMMELIKTGPTLLKPNSWLGFEVGLGQGDALKRKLEHNPIFKEIKDYRDSDGQIRALFGLVA
jgi:release factor glutamine methyltransferase